MSKVKEPEVIYIYKKGTWVGRDLIALQDIEFCETKAGEDLLVTEDFSSSMSRKELHDVAERWLLKFYDRYGGERHPDIRVSEHEMMHRKVHEQLGPNKEKLIFVLREGVKVGEDLETYQNIACYMNRKEWDEGDSPLNQGDFLPSMSLEELEEKAKANALARHIALEGAEGSPLRKVK